MLESIFTSWKHKTLFKTICDNENIQSVVGWDT